MSTGNASLRRDPGAQPERTRFAWRRSTLTFAVAVALAVRHALYAGGGVSPAEAVAAAAGLLVWLVFLRSPTAVSPPWRGKFQPGCGAGVVLWAVLCTLSMVMVGMMLLW